MIYSRTVQRLMGQNLALPAYSVNTGDRPIIPVRVRDGRGQFQTIPMLLDSGNDQTIITESTRQQLGLPVGGTTRVQGVNGAPMPFNIVPRMELQIGNTRPIVTSPFSGNSPLNLIGRKDVMKNFDILLKGDGGVSFKQKDYCPVCI